ncbi:uncharacterized protein FFFS_11932 [Fusarium fujikuroi]|nr:uncharacterized protein FFFS_11932 [Fusarium fujikuroi]
MKPRPPKINFDGLGGTDHTTVGPECNRRVYRYGSLGLQCPLVTLPQEEHLQGGEPLSLLRTNGAEGMRTPARTPKNSVQKVWERPSCDEMDIFGNKTPIAGNRKHRRLDPAEHMAFDVNEKLEEATSSILNLGLPSVTNLKQELNERRKERGEHNEVIENKKDDLEKCQTEGASRAREHEEYKKACTELESKLKDDERRVNKWLSEFPQDLNFAIDTEKYKAPGEATWKPEKDNLVEAQSRKRKAMKKVLEEGKVIEEEVKAAYMRREFVDMQERHLEDHQALLSRFEGDEWEKQLD